MTNGGGEGKRATIAGIGATEQINQPDAPIIPLCGEVIALQAMPETSVAATKSFIASLAAFAWIVGDELDVRATWMGGVLGRGGWGMLRSRRAAVRGEQQGVASNYLWLLGVALLTIAQAAFGADGPALMPMPRSVELPGGSLAVSGQLATSVVGCNATMVPGAVVRFGQDLATLTGTSLNGEEIRMTIRCDAPDPHLLSLEAKEAYRLTVSSAGIVIHADGETGVVRALATLRQLISRDAKGPIIPLVRIDDAPRFAWRGIMIDTARHFISFDSLKRQVAAMELAKLNVLHLHLSDNEGFRVESKRLPRLTTIASHGQYYTQDEIRELVRYAGERGIRIVPEIDLPGHSQALLAAYPELAVPIDANVRTDRQKAALDLTNEKTYRLLHTLLREMTALFPDQYFHVGGDEVRRVAWDTHAVNTFEQKHGLDPQTDLESYFHDRVRAMLAADGKSVIGWDELSETNQPASVVIQAWRTSNQVSIATAKGHRVIVSAGYYLDFLQPAEQLYAIDPLDTTAFGTMMPARYDTLRRVPAYAGLVTQEQALRPLPPLTVEEEKLVLGGEAPLWTEMVTDEMLDGRLWPRGLAVAERLWSPASQRASEDMYRRMLPAADNLRALGVLDVAHRNHMIARLAPAGSDIVSRMVDVVAPVRNFAHSHSKSRGGLGVGQEFVELADAATTDPSVARSFQMRVKRYLAGDRSQSTMLRGDLARWCDNEAPYRTIAAGTPLLEAAIPTARDIGSLGELGLAALDAIEQRKPIPAGELSAGRTLLDKLEQYEAASADPATAKRMPQPPADLIVLPWPDVARLVDAAVVAGVK